MKNIAIVIIIAVLVLISLTYIIKAKKSGAKCVGCPYSKECGKKECCTPTDKY